MSTGTLIRQWRSNNKQYRAIGVGRYTAGYRDIVVVERADSDSLGGVRWVEVDRWDCSGLSNKDDIRSILIDGITVASSPETE